MKQLERKSDRIKILETDSYTLSKNHGYRCLNCKEQYQLIPNPGDKNNLKCMNCGALTPKRTVKHSRGLAAPSIQTLAEQTAVIQSDKPNVKGRDRRPKGINSDKRNELEESLVSKGFQVTDSNVVQPI